MRWRRCQAAAAAREGAKMGSRAGAAKWIEGEVATGAWAAGLMNPNLEGADMLLYSICYSIQLTNPGSGGSEPAGKAKLDTWDRETGWDG